MCWHGHTFDVLAQQFHLLVEPEALESCYLGHADIIASIEGLTVPDLRTDGQPYGPTLQGPAQPRATRLASLAAQGTVEAVA